MLHLGESVARKLVARVYAKVFQNTVSRIKARLGVDAAVASPANPPSPDIRLRKHVPWVRCRHHISRRGCVPDSSTGVE